MDRYSAEARGIYNKIIDAALEAQKKGHFVSVELCNYGFDIYATWGGFVAGKPLTLCRGISFKNHDFAERCQGLIEDLEALCECDEKE